MTAVFLKQSLAISFVLMERNERGAAGMGEMARGRDPVVILTRCILLCLSLIHKKHVSSTAIFLYCFTLIGTHCTISKHTVTCTLSNLLTKYFYLIIFMKSKC